jgi:hypothetical protein
MAEQIDHYRGGKDLWCQEPKNIDRHMMNETHLKRTWLSTIQPERSFYPQMPALGDTAFATREKLPGSNHDELCWHHTDGTLFDTGGCDLCLLCLILHSRSEGKDPERASAQL